MPGIIKKTKKINDEVMETSLEAVNPEVETSQTQDQEAVTEISETDRKDTDKVFVEQEEKSEAQIFQPETMEKSELTAENDIVSVSNEDTDTLDQSLFDAEEDSIEDLSKYVSVDLEPQNSAVGTGEGVASIINNINGKRVSLPRKTWETLQLEDTVQFALKGSNLAVGKKLPNGAISQNLRSQGGSKIVYSAPLVRLLTSHFSLDYSKRTSITFTEMKIIQYENNVVGIINMKKERTGNE